MRGRRAQFHFAVAGPGPRTARFNLCRNIRLTGRASITFSILSDTFFSPLFILGNAETFYKYFRMVSQRFDELCNLLVLYNAMVKTVYRRAYVRLIHSVDRRLQGTGACDSSDENSFHKCSTYVAELPDSVNVSSGWTDKKQRASAVLIKVGRDL